MAALAALIVVIAIVALVAIIAVGLIPIVPALRLALAGRSAFPPRPAPVPRGFWTISLQLRAG